MNDIDNQVRETLQQVKGAYPDFITGCMDSMEGNPEAEKKLLDYLKNNPEARTGEVLNKIIADIMPDILDDEDED